MSVNGQQSQASTKSVVSQVSDILSEASGVASQKTKRKQREPAQDEESGTGKHAKGERDQRDRPDGRGKAKEQDAEQDKDEIGHDEGSEDERDPIVTPQIRDDDDDQADDQADTDDDESEGDELDFDKLADTLGVKRKHLYGLKVPLGNGQFATIGELKDSFQTAETLKARQTEVEEAHGDNLRAQMRAQQELSEVISMLPQIKPEVLTRARARLDEVLKGEFNSLRKYLPEWGDKGAREVLQQKHLKRLAQWGINKNDYHSITDHRVIRFIHDADRAFAKLEKARAINQGRDVPAGHKGTTRTSSAHKQDAHHGPAKTNAEAVARIGKLLKD